MKPVIPLRVGVCSCSPQYERRLQGRTFKVGKQTFRIQEVYIFARNQREALKGGRCHFFVDNHYLDGRFEVDVVQIVFVSNGEGRGWKMFIGGCGHNLGTDLRREWKRKRPPTTTEVITKGIKSLLDDMPAARLEKWLSNSTPLVCE